MGHPRKSQSILAWSLDLPLASAPAQIVSGGTSVTTTIAQTQTTMEAYVASLLQGEAYEAFFAGDIVATFVGTGYVLKGLAAAKRAIDRLLHGDLEAELAIRHLLVGPGIASHEAVLLGVPVWKIARTPPSGGRVDVRHSVFYDLADGKITALRVHGLTDGLLQHLSANPGYVAVTSEDVVSSSS